MKLLTRMKVAVVAAVCALATSLSANAGQRVVCHYDTIEGRVGQELVKPNGDHYFDVDLFDFDTAPVQGYGDSEMSGYSGSIPGVSNPLSAYKKKVKEHPSNKDGKDSPSWYHPNGTWYDGSGWSVYTGPYHPIVTTPTKAGTYNLSLTFSWDDGYTESINIKFIIRDKEPTVAASAANVVATYDGTAHGIAVSVSEPTSGVTVEYALSADGSWQSEAFSFTEVCAATQVWYRALAEGYLGVTNKATVTVNARPIQDVTVTLSLPDGGYKYDGTAKEPAVSVTDSFAGFSSSDYSVSYSDNVNAGTAKVVVTGVGSHYSGTKETTFAIAPRTLTFTSASAEWAWDGAAHSCETAPTVTGDGFVGEDGATFSGFASVTAPGTYENTFSYAFTSGTVAANYSVSQVYGKLRIFNYKASVKDDGTVKIDGLGDEPLGSTEIAIPEKIDGKPVTEIAEGAFANSTCGATSLTLAKYCKKIGASAFRGIGTLKTVTFVKVYETDDVTEAKLEIGANAFNSTGIASLSVPKYVQEIGNYAFANCGDLKRVAIPAGTTVSTKAFYRSGITAGAKPEVITFSAFTVSGSVATMKVTGTGGSIDVSGLAVYFSSSLGARAEWSKIDHSVGETVLTNTGCEVTVTVNVPTGAAGAYFYVELAN